MKNREEIAVDVIYGVAGANCRGRLARRTVAGLTARQLVAQVVDCRQPRGPAASTARVLRDVVRTSRRIDVELAANAARQAGRPIGFDDVVVEKGEQSEQDELVLRLSESYRGGA